MNYLKLLWERRATLITGVVLTALGIFFLLFWFDCFDRSAATQALGDNWTNPKNYPLAGFFGFIFVVAGPLCLIIATEPACAGVSK